MTAIGVFIAGLVLAQSQAASAPLLRIASIEPSTARACTVTLENRYSSPAIAWVLTDPTGNRYGSDVVLVPEVVIRPGHSQQMLFPCQEAQTPLVTVAAVQYDDGSLAGDPVILEESIQAPRRKQAEGFAQLAELIASAGAVQESAGVSVPDTLLQLIDSVAGPSVTLQVKLLARNSVERIRRRTPAAMSSYVSARDALALELRNQAALLRKLTEL